MPFTPAISFKDYTLHISILSVFATTGPVDDTPLERDRMNRRNVTAVVVKWDVRRVKDHRLYILIVIVMILIK